MSHPSANNTACEQSTESQNSAASNTSMKRSSSSSRTLLNIKGVGTREALVEHLLEVNKMIPIKKKPNMFKIEKSPLFAQLETFLPSLEESNKRLDALPEAERQGFCMEASDEDSGSRYIELSILESEQMQDSKVFQLLNLAGGTPSTNTINDSSDDSSSDEETDSDTDDGDEVNDATNQSKKRPLVRSDSDDDDSSGSRELSCDR